MRCFCVAQKQRARAGLYQLQSRPFQLHESLFCRRLAHQHAEVPITELGAAKISSEKILANIEKALHEVGSDDSTPPPPHYVLHQFFEQTKSIARVAELLRKGVWNWEVQVGLTNLGIKYDPPLITQVLRLDISCDVALSFFQWLKGVRRFHHNEYTYGAMLNALGRAGRLHDMQQLFHEMEADACLVTPVTLSNVMLWYSKAKDEKGIAAHWRLMRESGAKLSPAIFAVYLEHLLRAKRYTKVAVVFEQMLRVDCLPNSRTYTVFIQHLVESGKLDAAAKVLKIMQTVHLVPCRVVYKTLINAFAKSRNLERVLELLEEMKEHFHRPTKQLMPAIEALQKAGKSEVAAVLLEEISSVSSSSGNEIMGCSDDEEMDDSECSLSEWRAISSFNLGFDVNAFAHALPTWDSKVEEMLEQANVQWECHLVMGIFKRLRNVDLLWPFFHWLKDKVRYKHDSYSCGLLIDRIFKSKTSLGKKAFLVNELFEGLRSEGMKFTVPMFNRVIRYYVGAGEGDRVFALFKLMKEVELEPNGISYSLAIEGFAKNNQVDRVREFLEEMEEKGFYLSSSARAQYITCLGSVGKLEEAYTFFCSARMSGRWSSPDEYKAIIAAYDHVGDSTMALQLYDEMKKAGMEPTQDMHKVVKKVLQEANRLSDVQALVEARKSFDFFKGQRKEQQEKLLSVLFIFMENFKPRRSQNS
ncbi:hypothetical protein L7F22_051757 [Adiantum nelumboides]|nr:hypothetical protein [Adiantum nelumboides]